ncbi:MAG: TetR/AcrR family transcriptional regulator [Pseudomonadota bacterium]
MDETQKRKRGRPSTLDAESVLDTAMQAYWRKDPADVSINTICQMAEVSKPALYREFGNEDGLMVAVLDRYAEKVLSDIFEILAKGMSFKDTLDALAFFVSEDVKMETGCVFYKMRAGKHRLGPTTRARVDAIDTGAVDAFKAYLAGRRENGDWTNTVSVPIVARYLVEQMGLALTQRASGEDPEQVRETLKLALSAIH